mgnify:CR=1 FL=1
MSAPRPATSRSGTNSTRSKAASGSPGAPDPAPPPATPGAGARTGGAARSPTRYSLVTSVETPDDHTVVVNLSAPLADFPTNIAAWSWMYVKELVDNGLAVSAIASPIGKVAIDRPWSEHFDRFKTAVELADSARAGHLALLLGAGVSAAAGLPGWGHLIESLERILGPAPIVASRAPDDPVRLVIPRVPDDAAVGADAGGEFGRRFFRRVPAGHDDGVGGLEQLGPVRHVQVDAASRGHRPGLHRADREIVPLDPGFGARIAEHVGDRPELERRYRLVNEHCDKMTLHGSIFL